MIVKPGHRSKYVGYRMLLNTGRAVKHSGKWLRVSTAGTEPQRFWMQFDNKQTAKRAGGSLVVHLRERAAETEKYGWTFSDRDYNDLVFAWVEQLRAGGYVKNEKKDEGEAGND